MIATKDRPGLLRRVLQEARRDPATAEIVVVDDASTVPTASWLRSSHRDGAPLKVVRSAGVGAAAARQAGVETATGALVVLLDDDVLPRRGLVSSHRDLLDGHPERIALGYSPVALPSSRGPHDVARYVYARDYERRCRRYEQGRVPAGHNLWGGNVGLWREAALRVSLSSPEFPERQTFYEDRDFGLRAVRAGLDTVFARSLLADHHHRRSPAAALDDAERRGRHAVRLHRLHADLIGPYVPALLAEGLPQPLALGLRAARRPRTEAALLGLALAAIELGGRLRQWAMQDAAFKLARRLREQRGVLRALGGDS